jgi:hypothetical protein
MIVDFTSFIFGIVCVVVIIASILMVLMILKIRQNGKDIEVINSQIGEIYKNIDDRIQESISYTDSRIDKLNNK